MKEGFWVNRKNLNHQAKQPLTDTQTAVFEAQHDTHKLEEPVAGFSTTNHPLASWSTHVEWSYLRCFVCLHCFSLQLQQSGGGSAKQRQVIAHSKQRVFDYQKVLERSWKASSLTIKKQTRTIIDSDAKRRVCFLKFQAIAFVVDPLRLSTRTLLWTTS